MIENRVFGLHVTNENSCLSADNPHICIGWSALGDLSDYGTREEIELAYDKIYPDKTKNSRGVNIGQIARFKLEVNIGDYVVFRSNRLIHIGVVTSDYYYKTDVPNQDSDYVNNRDVNWVAHFPTSVLSEKASNSLGSAMSFFGMDSYKDELNALLDDSFLESISVFNELKKAKDIIPERYDGSFKLLEEVANAYKGLKLDSLNYKDLELFYFSCIGTWKSSFENKKERVINSNLPSEKKNSLIKLLEDLEKTTNSGFYEHSEVEGKYAMGMFGTGFGTFRGIDDADVKNLLDMLIKLASTHDENSCFNIVKTSLSKKIKGVKTGVLSPILFCLKPTIFPIINGNQGVGSGLYEKLGIIIKEPLEIENYIENATNIRDFRNKHFSWKNYRILDIASYVLKDSNQGTDKKTLKANVNENGIFTCNTGLSKVEWVSILQDNSLIDEETIDLLKQWYKRDNHEASCKEIGSIVYGDSENATSKVNGKITGRCQMICSKYGIAIDDEGQNRYFPVMMDGRNSIYDNTKVYNWILKPEVVEAMEELTIVKEESVSEETCDVYNKADFLSEVFITEDRYDEIKNVLERKSNIILQGTPGVGKTFMAKRLAYSLMGEKNDKRIEMIQFHQSYSYEDFIFGYQPTATSFELKPGIFYSFCKKAEKDLEHEYFFIIDEINRGNLSKIFGELLMLIENDKRGQKITLSHTQESFTVPSNIYIIGMMNTADRSLAIVDYALRRRFSMINVKPAFEHPNFKQNLIDNGCDNDFADKVIAKFVALNKEIADDAALGEGFTIGHSYFCNVKDLNESTFKEIVEYDIKPILEEYWFDDRSKAEQKVSELLK